MLNDTLESMFNYKKIRYVVLDELLKPYITYESKEINTVNFYIDVYSIIKNLYTPSIMESTTFSNDTVPTIVSQIINIAAHYRNYIWTRLGKYSNIYFVFSDKKDPFLVNINNEYKGRYYSKYVDVNPTFSSMNKVIKKSINLIKLIVDYLPNIYFINSQNIDINVCIYYLMNKSKKGEKNIILTRDKVQYQLVLNEAIVLDLKGNDTKVIDKLTLLDELLPKKNQDYTINLLPEFYLPILAIAGLKSYSLTGVPKYGNLKTIKLLDNLVIQGKLSNITYTLDGFLEVLKDNKTFKDESYLEIIKSDYQCLNIEFRYQSLKIKEIIKIIDECLINRVDAAGLRHINDTILGEHYIMLEELMMGEDYE